MSNPGRAGAGLQTGAGTRRALLRAVAATALLPAAPLCARAQGRPDYPTRAVSIILPFAPGSAADGVTRLCAQMLTQRYGQSFLVDNVGGASGTIGTARAARAEPDGYTLVVGSGATVTVAPYLFRNLPYDPVRQLAPIATMGDSPIVVAVPTASPVRDLQALIAAAKARPDGLSYGSGGAGSAAHIAGEVFRWKTGTSMVHIPYRGVAAAVPDLVAARLDALFVSYPAVEPMVRAGSLRVLAVASEARSPLVPNTPTAKEAGLDGYVLSAWNGLMGPAALPQPIIRELNGAINAVLTDPDVSARLAAMGMAPIPGSAEQFRKRITDELAEMEQLTRIARISAD